VGDVEGRDGGDDSENGFGDEIGLAFFEAELGGEKEGGGRREEGGGRREEGGGRREEGEGRREEGGGRREEGGRREGGIGRGRGIIPGKKKPTEAHR
jgi:hypothetical protein